MTELTKITKDYLEEYVSELGEHEHEHRKGSTFYASCSYVLKQADIDTLKEEGVDASDFLNICVTLNGIYDDWNGIDWDSMDFCKVQEYEELVPEQIIPAHTVKKQRTEKFDYKWEG